MNKKQIEGTHYSISEDGVVWDEKHNKELKSRGGSVSISFSVRKLLRTYFPQSIEVPEVEGAEHKSIGNYQVYNNGQVWSKKHFKFLTPTKDGKGHLILQLDGKMKKVHRLVYQAFVGAIPKGCDIHHKDQNKNNNSVSNLICLTHKEHAKLHSELRGPNSQQLKNLQKGRKEKLSEEHKVKIAASKKAWWDKVKNK